MGLAELALAKDECPFRGPMGNGLNTIYCLITGPADAV
jgi:hypothetical protein